MFDINFITPPKSLAGMEFLDYQPFDLVNGIKELSQDMIEGVNRTSTEYDDKGNSHTREWFETLVVENEEAQEAIAKLIFDTTGININIHIDESVGNMAIDSAFFLPNHILNNEECDVYLDKKFTRVGEAFKALKTDVLRGWVDSKTGKVGGDFSKIQFNLYISPVVFLYFAERYAAQINMRPYDAFAQIVLHEIGHAWGCFVTIAQQAIDSLLPLAVGKMFDETKDRKQKVAIFKDASAALEIAERVDDKIIEEATSDEIAVIFTKGIGNRNLRRTLSLGVAQMSSEMYADIFAVRFGASKELIYFLHDCPMERVAQNLVSSFALVLAVIAGFSAGAGLAACLAGFFLFLNGVVFIVLNGAAFVSGGYDTPYRRSKAILREAILRLKNDKNLKGADKARYARDVAKMEQAVEEMKPILESTFYSRFWGWVFAGSDFKARDFEFYTNELAGHSINLYTNIFKVK